MVSPAPFQSKKRTPRLFREAPYEKRGLGFPTGAGAPRAFLRGPGPGARPQHGGCLRAHLPAAVGKLVAKAKRLEGSEAEAGLGGGGGLGRGWGQGSDPENAEFFFVFFFGGEGVCCFLFGCFLFSVLWGGGGGVRWKTSLAVFRWGDVFFLDITVDSRLIRKDARIKGWQMWRRRENQTDLKEETR